MPFAAVTPHDLTSALSSRISVPPGSVSRNALVAVA